MELINRQARHQYFIEEEHECGIVLQGTEIKSIRAGNCNLRDSYAIIRQNELLLINMFIAPYEQGNIFNHEEKRTRKLLMHKKEIKKLKEKIEQQGFTLVPLKLYFVKDKVKVLLGVCRGKKNYDKRETLKERTLKRETDKALKQRF